MASTLTVKQVSVSPTLTPILFGIWLTYPPMPPSLVERRSTNNQEPDSPLSMSAEIAILRHGLDYSTGALAA